MEKKLPCHKQLCPEDASSPRSDGHVSKYTINWAPPKSGNRPCFVKSPYAPQKKNSSVHGGHRVFFATRFQC